jgi:inosine/xanthosine triphosphatase
MLRVVVASKNPVNLQAAAAGFARMFAEPVSVTGISVPSGVSDQPMSDAETLQGALQRVENARAAQPDADYWVGIEGGIAEAGIWPPEAHPDGSATAGDMLAFAWVVVYSQRGLGRGRTGTLCLPPRLAELVRAGKELGEADDIVFGRTNSKQETGAVGLLTGNVIDRAQYYEHAVVLALIPFKNEALYG